MAKRPDLVDITSITNSSTINAINQNWDRIQEAFDNTVSLDGSTPNAMNGDLDINGNALLNVGTIDTENLTLNGQQITDLASVPEWRSSWITATAYVKNDLVKTAGNVYICLESHTSGTFATDLTNNKWEVLVTKGDSGAGAGDLVSTNNLSDVADPAAARANLSLGTVATENIVPVAKGGTGATDAATARTNLGVQAAGATLTSLEGLSLTAGDVIYSTAADTLARLPVGTAGQTLVVNSGATAPEWVETTGTLGPIATTSGTNVDFNIPTWATEITVLFDGVSINNNATMLVQLGTGGVATTSGYSSAAVVNVTTSGAIIGSSSGFQVGPNGAAQVLDGMLILCKGASNTWWALNTGHENAGEANFGAGKVAIAGAVNFLRISGNTGTFDSGAVSVRYRR